MDVHGATATLGKPRKGKIKFTGNPVIGAPVPNPREIPSMSRRVFGTSRSSNIPFKPSVVPPARKTEKESVGFQKKNPRKDNVVVRQNPIASSPGYTARAWVGNPKPKLRSSSPSLAPKTSSRKTGHVDPEPEKSVYSLEKSRKKLKEDNVVAPQVPLASSPGSTVKARVSNLNPKPINVPRTPSEAAEKSSPQKATNAKPKKKSICLSGTSKKNLMEDGEAVLQTPVASSPCFAALSASKSPPSDVKSGETYQKSKDQSMCLARNSRVNDMVVLLPTPVVSYAEKPSSDDKSRDLGLKQKKKSVCFQDKSPRLPRTGDSLLPRTPMASPPGGAVKPRRSGTPYHTAESCRGCRLNRFETASYWLAQIKQAESAMMHFVSAAFFHLAFESKAEPARNMRVELRRYLARHARISDQPEWKDISLRYGLAKDVQGDCGVGRDCSAARDIGRIDRAGQTGNGQGDSREDIGEEPRERDVASPPGVRGEGY